VPGSTYSPVIDGGEYGFYGVAISAKVSLSNGLGVKSIRVVLAKVLISFERLAKVSNIKNLRRFSACRFYVEANEKPGVIAGFFCLLI
jgi:hypothetical protein